MDKCVRLSVPLQAVQRQSSSPEEPGDVLLPHLGHLLPPLPLLLLYLILLFICLCYLPHLQEPDGREEGQKLNNCSTQMVVQNWVKTI